MDPMSLPLTQPAHIQLHRMSTGSWVIVSKAIGEGKVPLWIFPESLRGEAGSIGLRKDCMEGGSKWGVGPLSSLGGPQDQRG